MKKETKLIIAIAILVIIIIGLLTYIIYDIMKEDKPRYFYVDDTFAIFLREKSKTKPYFAGRIDNITKFQ